MKILMLNDTLNGYKSTYIGNEFSPDPLDMLEKIKALGGSKDLFEKIIAVNCSTFDKYDIALDDIEKLLTKNGYVFYNPCIINVYHEPK